MAVDEDDIYVAIEAMLIRFCTVNVDDVLRAFPQGRVSLPNTNNYIIMTLLDSVRTSTPISSWDENTYRVRQPKRSVVQLDFFGDAAKHNADVIVDLSRTPVLCDFLKSYSIQPLYAEEARNLTGISGEKKYVPRWSVQFHLDYQTTAAAPVDTFKAVKLNKIEVEN